MLGMQGLGGPGVHQCQMTYFGMPRAEGLGSVRFFNPDLPERLTKPAWTTVHAWGPQLIPKTLIQDAILKVPLVFHGSGGQQVPDRGAVHQVHVSHREGEGRRPDPHDLDRHPMPHHLLEPR